MQRCSAICECLVSTPGYNLHWPIVIYHLLVDSLIVSMFTVQFWNPLYFRKNRDHWSKKDKQADLRWKWHNWSKRENRLMVVTVWTFYISLPHLPPLTDVTVHSFHNPPVLKIWHQCTFIFTIFRIKNVFSLLVLNVPIALLYLHLKNL